MACYLQAIRPSKIRMENAAPIVDAAKLLHLNQKEPDNYKIENVYDPI